MNTDRLAIDLITLYHPAFWGLESRESLARLEPRAAWDRMLGTVRDAGVTGVEVTFPPGDVETAAAAYGSIGGLHEALSAHGLRIVSGYFSGLDDLTRPLDAEVQRRTQQAAGRYATSLAKAGGEIVISGMPRLDASVDRGGRFLDLDYIKALADFVNRIGGAVAAEGLRYALHPEFGSVFCRPREIDLFMLLTDPDVVGFCPDTAHILLAGGDPVAITERHRERLVLTHWKDAAGAFTGVLPEGSARHAVIGPMFMAVGEGAVDWHGWQQMLDRTGYDGWNVLELDGSPEPEAEVARAREFVVTALA
jgi:sugar phosphate isomerase/epimerase